jgi:MFS family permease
VISKRPRPQGILVGIGSLAVIAAGFVAAAVPQADATFRYGVLVGTIMAFAAVADVWAASVAVGVIGFLVFDGFLVNRLGELSWHGSADLSRLLALAAAVAFGRLVGEIYRSSRLLRPGRPRSHAVRLASPATIVQKGARDGFSPPGGGPRSTGPVHGVVHILDEEKRDA